jgi:hypothetical protein
LRIAGPASKIAPECVRAQAIARAGSGVTASLDNGPSVPSVGNANAERRGSTVRFSTSGERAEVAVPAIQKILGS